MKAKNSLEKGTARYIIFREASDWYGVCLEFNIVESGDTPQEAMLLLFEAMQGYLASARKIKARPSILNQTTDREYERMWGDREKTKKTKTDEIFTFGQMNIPIALSRQATIAA